MKLIYSGYFYKFEKNSFNILLNEFLKNFNISKNFILFIHSVDDKKSRELNKKLFNKNYPTDVLTVPIYSNLNQINKLSNENNEVIGDIFLNRSLIKVNAKKFNKLLSEEFQLVLLHGLLHIIGYSHNQQSQLTNIENKILNKVWS